MGESFGTGAELGGWSGPGLSGRVRRLSGTLRGGLRAEAQELMVCTGVDSQVPVPVVDVITRNVETQRKVGDGDGQLAPLEVISSLVARLLRTAQEGRLADEKVPLQGGMGSSSAMPPVTSAEGGH